MMVQSRRPLAIVVTLFGALGPVDLDAQPRNAAPTSARVRVQRGIALAGRGYAIVRPTALIPASSGELVVLPARAEGLVVLDSTGKFVRVIGRRGSGPGEMQMPTVLGTRGDSLWLFDRALSRLTVFDARGRFVRSIRLPASGVGTLHRDGTVTVHSDRVFGMNPARRDMLRLQHVGPDARASSARFPAEYFHRSLVYASGSGNVVGLQPFDDGPLLSPVLGGSGFWYVREAKGTNGPPVLRVVRTDPDWKVQVSRDHRFAKLPLGQDVTERAVTEVLAERHREQDPAERRSLEQALYRPAHLPTATAIVAGVDGSVAVRREDVPGDSTRWTWFNSDGSVRSEFRLGRRDVALAIRGRTVWLRRELDDGEEELLVAQVGGR